MHVTSILISATTGKRKIATPQFISIGIKITSTKSIDGQTKHELKLV
jgi:hypothetical protein|tara:strand:- start:459 stop:599 length:141 start_codon:yes stop_codon:yes gene_type:complete